MNVSKKVSQVVIKMGFLKEQLLKDGFVEVTIQKINQEITEEQRQKAIQDMECAICGNKLNAHCYAEDEYAIECIFCDVLYKE